MSLVKVTFEWDDTFGPCYDCGRPAAYEVREPRLRYCSVCAAQQAADGEQITWLFADQYAEPQPHTGKCEGEHNWQEFPDDNVEVCRDCGAQRPRLYYQRPLDEKRLQEFIDEFDPKLVEIQLHVGAPDEMCWCGVVHHREDDDRSAW